MLKIESLVKYNGYDLMMVGDTYQVYLVEDNYCFDAWTDYDRAFKFFDEQSHYTQETMKAEQIKYFEREYKALEREYDVLKSKSNKSDEDYERLNFLLEEIMFFKIG
ncbi:hypothetical protein MCG45_15810 [Clostridium perfringens]|uniref:hypothetical protein n=1 Tax=Clostridium perfringens TaxID=1502 RepID=UPI001F070E31|nr:hypothetical protein [Clostridium perfringens]MCH1964295.1 hypothetical protein [Clostridium perfringens]